MQKPDFILAIYDSAVIPEVFLGSGVLIGPDCIVTCRHVLCWLGWDRPIQTRNIRVKLDGKLVKVRRCEFDSKYDLALVFLKRRVGVEPARWCEWQRWFESGRELRIGGYSKSDSGRKLGLWEVRRMERHWDGERVDELRADNGATAGYSGGALLVKTEDGYVCAGVSWLGGAEALHSHILLTPRIRDLAKRHRVKLDETHITLPPEGVPALPPRFMARPQILKRLRETLVGGSSSVALVAMQGMGGLGKSVLAAALAQDGQIRRAFPDGIHWISMANRPSLEALVPRMQDILDTLNEPGSERRDPVSIAARFSEALGRNRVLIVADDCWDDSARHLVSNGITSRLLITTRDKRIARRMGAQPFQIDILEPKEAADLAKAVVGAEELPPDGIRLVGECKGLVCRFIKT